MSEVGHPLKIQLFPWEGQLKHLIIRKIQCKGIKFYLLDFTALHTTYLNESVV